MISSLIVYIGSADGAEGIFCAVVYLQMAHRWKHNMDGSMLPTNSIGAYVSGRSIRGWYW
jgi:hypothetical protein